MFLLFKIIHTFAPVKRNRKVAQLVAHYVRDVGVGRSSRLFPTKQKRGCIFQCILSSFLKRQGV